MSICTKCNVQHERATDYERGAPAGFTCRYCGGRDVRIVSRLTTKPIGTWSLAGAGVKAPATTTVHAICGDCGHESQGR